MEYKLKKRITLAKIFDAGVSNINLLSLLRIAYQSDKRKTNLVMNAGFSDEDINAYLSVNPGDINFFNDNFGVKDIKKVYPIGCIFSAKFPGDKCYEKFLLVTTDKYVYCIIRVKNGNRLKSPIYVPESETSFTKDPIQLCLSAKIFKMLIDELELESDPGIEFD